MTSATLLPPLKATRRLIAQARVNCANRATARDQLEEADRYRSGANDQGWAIRHEVNRLKSEQSR